MFCPNCGRENGKDAKFCAVCGNSLMEKSTNDQAARNVTIPYGQYNGVNSSVTLTETKLRVTCQQNSGHYESEIPYDELVHVRFVHAPKATVFSFGYLVFRGKQNEEQPIVDKKANQDRTTVTMTAEQEQLFFPLFCLLRLLAPASARFTIGGGILSDAVSSEDGEKLFAQYEPYRYRAAKVLEKKKGIKPKEAKAAADYWFDSRQMDQYRHDPEKIPEDMNLALGIKQSIVRTDAMPHTIPEEDLVKKYSCYIGDNPQDSSAAMVKLRTDTGMSPMEAIRVVEAVYKHKEHSRQVTGADNTVRSTKACPVCGSNRIWERKIRKRHIHSSSRGFGGAVLETIYIVLVLIYIFMPNPKECVCLDCGHSWKS